MPKDIVWVAEMHTGHFDFIGVGKTQAEAEGALAKRWNLHAKIYELPRWNQGMGQSATVGEYFGMWNRPMKMGVGYLDSESEEG
jgi:hypothetical protein